MGGERSSWVVRTTLVTLLVVQGVWLATLAVRESPTYDEPCYVGAGDVYLRHGDLTWNPEHPPLMKLLVGTSLRVVGADPPPGQYETGTSFCYPYGAALLYDAGNDPDRVLFAARVPSMLLALGLTAVGFAFARDLFGPVPALVPTALLVLYPPLLAHGHYATDDVAAALAVVAVCWCTWRASRGDVRWLAGAALAAGLGLAAKFTVLTFLPAAAVLVWLAAGANGRPLRRRVALGLGWLLGMLAVVWLVYLVVDRPPAFEGPLPRPAAEASGPAAALAERLPLPAPARVGIRYELGLPPDARRTFVLGESYDGGRPAYFPVLLAATTPLAMAAMWVAGVVSVLRRRRRDVGVYVLGPAAWLLAVAMVGDVNLGVRTILAVPVLLTVATGIVLEGRSPRRSALVGGAAVGLTLASVAAAMPWALSYANEAAGGPDRLYEIVNEGDWGQDYGRLRHWLEARPPGEPVVGLHLETTLSERQLGLDVPRVDHRQLAGLPPGLVVASVNLYDLHRDAYRPYGEPIGQVTPSLLVFRVGPAGG